MNNPLHIQVQPIGGQQLDTDWRKKARQRAVMADAHYRYEIENAWKRGNESPDPNIMRAARLSSGGKASSQSAMPMQGTHSSPSGPSWEDVLGRK